MEESEAEDHADHTAQPVAETEVTLAPEPIGQETEQVADPEPQGQEEQLV